MKRAPTTPTLPSVPVIEMPEQARRRANSGPRWLATALAVGISLATLGCPPEGEKKAAPRTGCTSFGATCEFSPGKLGSCVRRDDCTGNDCFVCQSQH